MNLAAKLARRDAEGRPVRVGLIGAGKFGTMFLSQARFTPGVRVAAIADLNVARARLACERAGWPEERVVVAANAGAVSDAARQGRIALVEDSAALVASDLDVVVEATGIEEVGAWHAFSAIEAGKHVVMVNVETDVVVGPILRRLAEKAGVVYSFAYGDQPALIVELCDWARACGFRIVAAGKGTKYLPEYRRGTPETSLQVYGFTPEQIRVGGFNPKMFNSFLDGTKSAIEMAAVANATGLLPEPGGLRFDPVRTPDIPERLKPRAAGGVLTREGVVEVVSSHTRDAATGDERELDQHLRQGVYIVFTSDNPYSVRCFTEYGFLTDASGEYACLFRPVHLIGLELGISVSSAALLGEATGAPIGAPVAEVVGATRRPMAPGDEIDGEGGYACYGLLETAANARARGYVPMGLMHGLKLKRAVPADHVIRYEDVEFNPRSFLYALRQMQERLFPIPAAETVPA